MSKLTAVNATAASALNALHNNKYAHAATTVALAGAAFVLYRAVVKQVVNSDDDEKTN